MMRTVVESPNRPQIDWERAYGSIDGSWLRAEFEHITSGLDHIESTGASPCHSLISLLF